MPSHHLRPAASPWPIRARRAAAITALFAVVLGLAACGSGGSPGASPQGTAPGSSGPTPSAPPGAASPRGPAPPGARLVAAGPIPGLLLIADRGNDRLLLVDNKKRVLWTYPRPGHRPSFPFRFDDDAFFTPGYRAVISNQEDQETIQIVSFPAGNVVWHYGHPGVAGSSPGYLHTPDDAYMLPDGTRQVADVFNCRVVFISPEGKIVRQIGTTGVGGHDPPRHLASPNGDAPMAGGGTLITEINGSYVSAVSRGGRLLWSTHTPAAYPSDAQLLPDGTVLLTDYSGPGAVLIISKHGRLLWRYGPAGGDGRLDHPSLAIMLPNGLIAVNDDYRHRVVILKRTGRTGHIVWQYGHTDAAGAAPGYLDTPDGMDLLPARVVAADPQLQAALGR